MYIDKIMYIIIIEVYGKAGNGKRKQKYLDSLKLTTTTILFLL